MKRYLLLTYGKVITDINGGNDKDQAVAIQSDEKIVVAGYSRDGDGDYDFLAARYIGEETSAAIPTLNEWGLIIFMWLLFLSSFMMLKKQRSY